MIVTPQVVARIALLLILGVVVQVSFFSKLSFLGTSPDLVAVLVVCLGLLGGGLVGAVCGFFSGLLLDSVLLQTLGVSSLVLVAVGYLAGRYREGFEISSSLIPPLLCGGFTLLAAGGFATIQLMLGVEAPISLLVFREILVKAALSVLVGAPVYVAVRRVLRSALVEDAPQGRPVRVSPVRAS